MPNNHGYVDPENGNDHLRRFEQVFLMNNAMVKQQLEVFEVYIFNNSIASGSTQYSYSTAIGIFKSVINTGLVILTNWIANRKGYEGVM